MALVARRNRHRPKSPTTVKSTLGVHIAQNAGMINRLTRPEAAKKAKS